MSDPIEFSGTVVHQLDEKGRMRIPSKFMPEIPAPEKKDAPVQVCLVAGSYPKL